MWHENWWDRQLPQTAAPRDEEKERDDEKAVGSTAAATTPMFSVQDISCNQWIFYEEYPPPLLSIWRKQGGILHN